MKFGNLVMLEYSANMQLKPTTLLCITNLTSNDLIMKIM